MRLTHISLLTLLSARGNASLTHPAQEAHQAQQARQPQQTQLHADPPPTTSGPKGTVISEEDIRELSRRISELSNVSLGADRFLIENIRQRLDESLRKCWIKLGLPVEEIELFTGIPGTFHSLSGLSKLQANDNVLQLLPGGYLTYNLRLHQRQCMYLRSIYRNV
jgi:hypothetical protein